MSTFQPIYGEIGATAYRYAPTHSQDQVESFLWKLLLLTALAYFVWSDRIAIGIGPISIQKTEVQRHLAQRKTDLYSLLGFGGIKKVAVRLEEDELDNLTFAIDPTYADRFGIESSAVQERMLRCSLFVKRFSPVAIAEMRQFGVPASILLAQALLASDAGDDVRALESNNFFLRPCSATSCEILHTVEPEATDDPIRIDVYANLWGSFRAQSLYLQQTKQFSELFQTGTKNYHTWAAGLAAGGYSEDYQYGEKLEAVIQGLGLGAFDEK